MAKKSVLGWLNQLVIEKKKLSIGWEGGGDSGWLFFNVDGEQVENEYTEALIDYMYNHLSYGSWAGEFSANGEAFYDFEKRTFEGTDYYSEDDSEPYEVDYELEIPKNLWFDTFHIEVESSYDETPNMSIQFHIKNGFLTKEHLDFCSNLETVLQDKLDTLFSHYKSSDGSEFRGCNDSWFLNKSEFKDENDMLTYHLDTVNIQVMTAEDRYVVLEITDEIIKNIDEKLNENEYAK